MIICNHGNLANCLLAVHDEINAEKLYTVAEDTASAIKGVLMVVALVGAIVLGSSRIENGEQSVGRFTTLLMYWGQMHGKQQCTARQFAHF